MDRSAFSLASFATPRPSSRAHSRPAARALRPFPTAQPHISRSEIGCGSSRPYRCPERRSADRFSVCEHAWQSLGTCRVARLGDGDRSVGVRCSFCCRMSHRQLARRGRSRGRQSSCVAADHRRWTGWRSLRSRRLALWARTSPLRTADSSPGIVPRAPKLADDSGRKWESSPSPRRSGLPLASLKPSIAGTTVSIDQLSISKGLILEM
jgi:hypothetical protein